MLRKLKYNQQQNVLNQLNELVQLKVLQAYRANELNLLMVYPRIFL